MTQRATCFKYTQDIPDPQIPGNILVSMDAWYTDTAGETHNIGSNISLDPDNSPSQWHTRIKQAILDTGLQNGYPNLTLAKISILQFT